MSYITIIIENQQHKTNLSSKSLASSVLDSVTALYKETFKGVFRFESCIKNESIASSSVRHSFTNADATGVDKKRGLVVG